MSSKSLISKARQTLSDDGLGAVLKKTKNFLIFRAKTGRKKEKMKDVLFVNGCTLTHPERYRVDHQMEQLEANGLSVDKILYTQVEPERLKFYRAVVIFRCPITNEVRELIERAHYFNKRVFFDVDDLVIDTKYTDRIEHVAQMNREDKAVYDDGVKRMGETMKLCDYCITTTPTLARELEKYGKDVYINKNVANERMVKLSLMAMEKVVRDARKVRIGYLSGSITHNPDFELIKPALIKIMDEYKNVELVVMGHLDLPEDLKRFGGRIVKQPFINWEKLPEVIAGLDINLAPIEKTLFNAAKSENKWTEAALCKVATVASDFGAFGEVIEDGKTGMLCKDGKEWYEKLRILVEDAALRKKLGENAHKKVMQEYVTTYSGRGLARFIESKLAQSVAFVLPSTNVSGGVNVVLKHAEILRKNGVDATIIDMDKSDENMIVSGEEINVVSAPKHDFAIKFDEMVATLFTTLRFVKEYPDVKRKCYLVQNFETDFNEYGSVARKEANATYSEDGVEYLTISKWCKKWLERDFGRRVKYAPNGIDLDEFEFRERKFGGNRVKILIEGNSDDYYKNVDESFRIVERLDKEKFEIVYLSYQGEPKKWYRVDKFYHKVPHSEVGKIYAECDILLKTSILESFSYPPLEMMATGGYVVAVPNGGNQEYLKDEENCLFYNQGDVEMAVEKIKRIVEDTELRKKLVENSKIVVAERDWGKLEEKVLELYK